MRTLLDIDTSTLTAQFAAMRARCGPFTRRVMGRIAVLIENRMIEEVPEGETLRLKNSLRVEVISDTTLEAGSYALAYNLAQHENLDYYHPKPGAKAKYVEDPALEVGGEALSAPMVTRLLQEILNG